MTSKREREQLHHHVLWPNLLQGTHEKRTHVSQRWGSWLFPQVSNFNDFATKTFLKGIEFTDSNLVRPLFWVHMSWGGKLYMFVDGASRLCMQHAMRLSTFCCRHFRSCVSFSACPSPPRHLCLGLHCSWVWFALI